MEEGEDRIMDENNTFIDLLRPSLPGAWIAEHLRIWQMNFLNASELASFGKSRGLASYSTKDIIQFWQLGLLKADLLRSCRKLSQIGLIYRGTDRYGRHIYSDERQLPRRLRSWKNAQKNLKPLREGIDLLFHPFRYYVLYHINKELDLHISKMQMLYQDGFTRVLDWSLSSFNRWMSSEQFTSNIRKWNNIASLSVITEPCTYLRIFNSIRYDPTEISDHSNGAEEIHRHMVSYWEHNVKELYQRLGVELLEKIRQDLCYDTQSLEPNRWIHTLLCLGDSRLRIELEGNLGGALLLRTMAEMLRRATEEAITTLLREEDELGTGWLPKGVKETLYGSNRILDDQQAGGAFARKHGLNYKPRVHVYGEGKTECGAFSGFFKMMGMFIPVTNLHGLIKEGKSMSKFFSDYLQSDIKAQMYSLVMIDGDLEDNVRIMESAAKSNQRSEDEGIFGRFFLSKPDFEFDNFELEELEEVLWRWVDEENLTQAERDQLHAHVKHATGSTEFFRGVKRAAQVLPQLVGYDKGEQWGEELMKFAWEYPLKQGRRRSLIEAVQLVMYWEKVIDMEPYEVSRKSYMVNPRTGELIARRSSNM